MPESKDAIRSASELRSQCITGSLVNNARICNEPAMTSPYSISNIDDHLSKTLNEAARTEIWENLFGQSCPKTPESRHAYFNQLYSDEQLCLVRGLKENHTTDSLALKTHRDILDVVEVLKKNLDSTRSQTISDLVSRYPSHTELGISGSIDLAIRIAFLVNARSIDDKGANPSTLSLHWRKDQTLREFFSEILPASVWHPQGRDNLTRLSARFTAGFMSEICGLRLEYTSSLQEHLRLDWSEGHPILRVFPYKACLSALATLEDPIIPKQVLNEAIQTLNLLFPVSDPGTEKVLMRHDPKIRFHVDEPYGGPRRLNLFDYDVWRGRLLELYEDIYQSPPASWTQLWKDDRNPQQFWTFWIALFILLLTVVSTIATVWQTIFSVLAYYRPH